jgi:hypothetical protein
MGKRSEGRAADLGRPATAIALAAVVAAVALAWRDVPRLPLVGEDYAIFSRLRAGGDAYEHLFRPLSGLWLRASYAAFGADSGAPFRVAVLALHAGNALLVYALAVGLFRRRVPALVAAVAYAVGAAATDSLAWVASASRPVSAFAMLIAANGLVRLGRERRLAPALVAVGLALQALANEDFYGTAALAAAWIGLCAFLSRDPERLGAPEDERKSRIRPRAALAGAAVVVGAAALVYLVFGRVPGSATGILSSGLGAAPGHALQRSRGVWAGLGADFPGAGLLPFALLLPLVAARRFAAAAFALGAWLASFVPFALDDPVPYRAFSTLAPNALILGGAVHGIALLVRARRRVERDDPGPGPGSARSGELGFGLGAVLAVLFGAGGPRVARLELWRDATREIDRVDQLVRARAWSPADAVPALVNLESSTLSVVAYRLELADVERLVTLDFLDAAGAYVPPAQTPDRPWIGRRLDGTYGEIDPATYFTGRTALPEVALVGELVPARDSDDARRLLADPAIDHARAAVVETDPAPLGPRGAAGSVVVLEPPIGDLVGGWGRMVVGVDAPEPTVLAVRNAFQYWHRMRFSPDQRIFSDVRGTRALRLSARVDGGEPSAAFFLDLFGFGVPLPAGAHRVELDWRRASPAELR